MFFAECISCVTGIGTGVALIIHGKRNQRGGSGCITGYGLIIQIGDGSATATGQQCIYLYFTASQCHPIGTVTGCRITAGQNIHARVTRIYQNTTGADREYSSQYTPVVIGIGDTEAAAVNGEAALFIEAQGRNRRSDERCIVDSVDRNATCDRCAG